MSSHRGVGAGADGIWAFLWCLGTRRDVQNKVTHLRLSVLLAVSLLGAALTLREIPKDDVALRCAVAVVPILLMVPWLFAWLRFLHDADELVRKIHMEGIAVGFWAGVASSIGYIVLVGAGLPELHSSMAVAIVIAVMTSGYMLGRIFAGKRYR